MTPSTRPADVSSLVDALLECTAPITQILDHMVRAPDAQDVDGAVALLREVLADVLAPFGTVLAARDLRTTTAILEAVAPMICEEVLLVPHAPPAPPRRDPRDAHRRQRRLTASRRRRGD
jgi:hypothetical protein